MPSVTPEASVWTQLGSPCKVEGPWVSETPVERAACQTAGLSAARLIHKERTCSHILDFLLCSFTSNGNRIEMNSDLILFHLSGFVPWLLF